MADEAFGAIKPRSYANDPNMEKIAMPEQGPPCSFLDFDFLLALFVALIIDILNWAVEIGIIVNLVIGWGFIFWAKSKGASRASAPGAGQAPNIQNKLVRKALKRWGGQFIPFWNNTFGWTRFVLDMLKQPKNATIP